MVYRHNTWSIDIIYVLYREYIHVEQVEICKIWAKIKEIGPNQVHISPWRRRTLNNGILWDLEAGPYLYRTLLV